MAKKTKHSNFRVVIEPELPFRWRFENQELYDGRCDDRCEEIKKQIKQHVDNVLYVSIEKDTTEICEYCQNEWEVATVDDIDVGEPDEYTWIINEPMCCNKASNEWRDKHGYPARHHP